MSVRFRNGQEHARPVTQFAPTPTTSAKDPSRKTIAVFIDFIDILGAGYQSQLCRGFETACCRLDINLILVFGRTFDAPHSEIYHLFTNNTVDGIILTTNLSAQEAAPKLAEWVDAHRSIQLCCAGFTWPGLPSVVVDNLAGMRAVIDHLIVTHGRTKLAYLAGVPGNKDAESRFDVYRDALQHHGLAFDPDRIATGYFVRHLGNRAMLEIIDRGTPFDAVVAANDGMALGAIEALRRRGFRVPRDIPVTGFDDMEQARLGNPPMTTVWQPVANIAEKSVQLLVDRLTGKEVPSLVELASECLIRRSCGCRETEVQGESLNKVSTPEGATQFLSENRARIVAMLTNILEPHNGNSKGHAALLVNALVTQLDGQTGAFDAALEDTLEDIRSYNEGHQALQVVIDRLRNEFRGFANRELDDTWDHARRRIALSNTHSQAQQRYALAEDYERWIGINENLAGAFDLESLSQRLIPALLNAGLSSFAISLFKHNTLTELVPYVAVIDGRPVELPVSRYAAKLIFPPNFQSHDQRHTWVAYPLVFEGLRQGIALFENGGVRGNLIICTQISAALKNARLHQEIVEKTLLHERSVQERLATTKRMESLSILAGGVAHDLNNAFGPLVALPEVVLAEVNRLKGANPDAILDLVADVDSIRVASLRAAETIKDLLTLGRQGRISKDRLDLNRLVGAYLAGEPLRFLSDAAKRIRIDIDLCNEPLVLLGSESQLMRAFANLIRNAAEAIESSGTITVKTAHVHLTEPLFSYETIEPGEYISLVVADTGTGIPEHDLGRIFEPFYSKKKAGEHSGSGLGLAIVHGVVKEHSGFLDVTSARRKRHDLHVVLAAGCVPS